MSQRHNDALDDYFGALLSEEAPALQPETKPKPEATAKVKPTLEVDPDTEARRQGLESLLAQVAQLKEQEALATPVVTPEIIPEVAPMIAPVQVESVAKTTIATEVEIAVPPSPPAATWQNMDTEAQFQVLYFMVAGMTFAVPLTHLGGIYEMTKLTHIFGKPNWFAGMMTERGRQLYVVDTARWAMPGHTAEETYQYLVTLGDSSWGLGCHQLKGTALLTREQVKWRTQPGARPWLAGMVKEKMCALLHVEALIELLEQGKNIDGQQV